jgi:hypothetical protein
MSTSERTINEGIEGPDTARVIDVHARAIGPQGPEEEAVGVVRRAIGMLDEMHRLLQALAPPEIEAAVARVYVGRVSDDRRAICWKLYATRYRMLADLFASRREAFVNSAAGLVAPQAEGLAASGR